MYDLFIYKYVRSTILGLWTVTHKQNIWVVSEIKWIKRTCKIFDEWWFSKPIDGRTDLRPPDNGLDAFINDGNNYGMTERIQFDSYVYLDSFVWFELWKANPFYRCNEIVVTNS